ncbi:MAG: YkgJ family cysteine cluster protein [Candidatus Bathyarchaeia archaeon]
MIDSPFGLLLPWKRVRDWFCSACGECCKHFEVQLSPYELARIAPFGATSRIRFEHGRVYLSKRRDGRCAFQERAMGLWICSLADRKPTLCKLWPFHVFNRPNYGRGEQAEYKYEGRRLYVYVNSYCSNVTLGRPTERLTTLVLPEVLDIALGKSNSQRYSTSLFLDLITPQMTFGKYGMRNPSVPRIPIRLG